jgi:hypothetical protein
VKIAGYMLITVVVLTIGYNILVSEDNAAQIKAHPIAAGWFGDGLESGVTFGMSKGEFLIVAATALVGGIMMVVKAKD